MFPNMQGDISCDLSQKGFQMPGASRRNGIPRFPVGIILTFLSIFRMRQNMDTQSNSNRCHTAVWFLQLLFQNGKNIMQSIHHLAFCSPPFTKTDRNFLLRVTYFQMIFSVFPALPKRQFFRMFCTLPAYRCTILTNWSEVHEGATK